MAEGRRSGRIDCGTRDQHLAQPAPDGADLSTCNSSSSRPSGLAGLVSAYGFGLGGTMGFLIFLLVLFIGVCVRVAQPILARLRP